MMPREEMTDTEIRAVVERTNVFIDDIGNAISEAIAAVDPASPCAPEARRGLARISATLRDVDFVAMCNLSTLDEAMKHRTGSSLIGIIALHLRAVGGGPTLDFENADAFLARFTPMIDLALRRHAN